MFQKEEGSCNRGGMNFASVAASGLTSVANAPNSSVVSILQSVPTTVYPQVQFITSNTHTYDLYMRHGYKSKCLQQARGTVNVDFYH